MPISANKQNVPVVILGLNDASLSIVRSLGRRGIHIIGIHDENTKNYYFRSKYIGTRIKSPLYGKALIHTLTDNVAARLAGRAVLFCATDSSVLTLSEYQTDLMPKFHFVLPSHDVTRRHISKKEFYTFAIENSFLVPKTFFTSSYDEIERVAVEISYPCIIKPEFRDQWWNERVLEKVLFSGSKQDLLAQIQRYDIHRTSLVIQEWIEGDDTEVFFCLAYLNRIGKPLALCTARKLRQYPHLTGSTSIAETVSLPELARESARLLTTAGCVGFCSVEYKRSGRDGNYYITEPTIGRPDTQEGIFLSSGIDVPYLAYCDALGLEVQALDNLKSGSKWINEPLAFYSLQECVRKRSDLRKVLSFWKGQHTYALWASHDPVPALLFYREKLQAGIKKLFGPNSPAPKA